MLYTLLTCENIFWVNHLFWTTHCKLTTAVVSWLEGDVLLFVIKDGAKTWWLDTTLVILFQSYDLSYFINHCILHKSVIRQSATDKLINR